MFCPMLHICCLHQGTKYTCELGRVKKVSDHVAIRTLSLAVLNKKSGNIGSIFFLSVHLSPALFMQLF